MYLVLSFLSERDHSFVTAPINLQKKKDGQDQYSPLDMQYSQKGIEEINPLVSSQLVRKMFKPRRGSKKIAQINSYFYIEI